MEKNGTNYFRELYGVNVSEWIEKKNGLSYLSWAYAWAELKKRHPDSHYTIYENNDGLNYHTDGRTCWVKTGVTVDGLEHIEYLPVMDNRNKSIELERVTSFDVNKAIQRSLTKACARHGLGLYIYAGEDLPEDEQPAPNKPATPANIVCVDCGSVINATRTQNGTTWTADKIAAFSKKQYGRCLCPDCQKAERTRSAELEGAKE